MNTQSHLVAIASRSLAKTIAVNRPALSIVVVCLIFVCAQSVAGTIATNSDQVAQKNPVTMEWGPLCRGLRLFARPIMNVFSLGDSIRLAVIVTNVTAEPIALTVIFPGSDDRYDVKFVVTDARGQRVSFTRLGSILDGGPRAVSGVEGRQVPPKGTIEDVLRIDQRFELGTTGTYFVTVRRLVQGDNNKLSPDLTSNTAKFEIVPAVR